MISDQILNEIEEVYFNWVYQINEYFYIDVLRDNMFEGRHKPGEQIYVDICEDLTLKLNINFLDFLQ